jgi:propanol-preferring alcohol dehydrogenase
VDDLRFEDVPEPATARGAVVVRVEACGVCGSDMHFLDGSARTGHVPITLGHEIAGRVVASTDPSWTPGDPVVVRPGHHCGTCARCREGRTNLCERARVAGIDTDGGLADLVAVPGATLVHRPADLAPEAAATAVDAGATAYHAVVRRGAVAAGDAVAVIGVGGLGSYAVQIARMLGATPVVAADVSPEALKVATALGADETVLVEPGISLGRQVKMLTEGGADVALEFVGLPATVDAAVKSLRPGGRAVAAGVGTGPLTTIPPVLWSNFEYSLNGSYGSLPGDVETVLAGLAAGRLVPPSIRRAGLEEAAGLIPAIARGMTRAGGRLVVTP